MTNSRDSWSVARDWEQAIWRGCSLSRLKEAVELVARGHALTHAALLDLHNQRFDAHGDEPLLRITDGANFGDTELQHALATERQRLCLGGDHTLARSWQVHALTTASGNTWVTVCVARVFFDRASIFGLLEALRQAYCQPEAALASTLTNAAEFRTFAHSEARRVGHHEMRASTGPTGPDLPRTATAEVGAPMRETIRLAGAAWSGIRAQALHACGGEGSPAAVVLTATASVLAFWSRSQTFAMQVWSERPILRSGEAGPPGQFSAVASLTIDETNDLSFALRVRRVHRDLTSVQQSGSASYPPSSHPMVAFSYSAAGPHNRVADDTTDRFTSVAASRPGATLEIRAQETADGALVIHFDFWELELAGSVASDLARATKRWIGMLASAECWTVPPSSQGWRAFPEEHMKRRLAANATSAPAPSGLLHSAFLVQVQQGANRDAVISRDRTLSYAALHRHACAVAHVLVSRGLRCNQLVAVAAERGWEQVASVLGVSMAGAAYLPLDLELPAERVRTLLESGEVSVVLTSSRSVKQLASLVGERELVAVDTLPANDAVLPPDVDVSPSDLAYVIFTSGSTGTPKGVMIEHRAALNTIADLNRRFSVGSTDRVLALSRLSFDLSVYDIFGMLAAGGALVVPEPDQARDPAHWLDLMQTHRITLWNTVPALMQLLVDSAGDQPNTAGAALRLVWMSGDWIPLSLPDRIHAFAPHAQVISMGGATEASIWSILFPVGAIDPSWRSVPYGKPMVNQTFHVLRENLAPAPDAVPGELYIGGVGVARGYWKDPHRTAERFITHPHTGERLYRTGDLGRYRADGNIEFLGRADFQVKVRGFRIELGEIETVLQRDPRIRAAVVVARRQEDATRHLVAYIVPATPEVPSHAQLQSMLRTRLPEYMVPSIFVPLAQLPLTSNGKVDHRALPEPDSVQIAQHVPTADRPTTELEEYLCELWRDVLASSRLGIHDDFFALGGNSLTGTRMILRLRQAFSVNVPIDLLFRNRTIHLLGIALEELLLQEISLEDPTS